MDLLALLSNAAASSSPVSVTSSQPAQKPNPIQDQSNAGRMLLDSLLRYSSFPFTEPHAISDPRHSSTAPQPPTQRTAESERSLPRQELPLPPLSAEPPLPQQHAQQASRKTAFDFVSPMDAFQSPSVSNPPSSLPKRNKTLISETPENNPNAYNNPPQTSSPIHGDYTMSSGTAVEAQDASGDTTKRKSIDLLEQLTRAAPISHQPINPNESAFVPPMTYGAQQSSQPSSIPYRGQSGSASTPPAIIPRDQSPGLMGQTPPSGSPAMGMPGPVLVGQSQAPNPARASPTFKNRMGGSLSKKDWKSKNAGDFLKSRSPAGPQSFTMDLSLPLAATSASSDRLHITPIALLKLESIYVPGCTIGVSHWIAYAMTKGMFFFPLLLNLTPFSRSSAPHCPR